jgi:hypothetical protein
VNLSSLIMGAVQNPGQQAQAGQMGNLFGMVQQLSQQAGTNPDTMQTLMSTVGQHVRGALQQKRQAVGPEQAEAIVDQHAGTQPDPQVVDQLFSPQETDRITQEASQRTGLNGDMVRNLLPVVVPLILRMLQGGRSTQGGGNPLLSSFLDADRDGDMDVGDAVRMAATFFGNR